MGPVNAAVRFVCELVALVGIFGGTWSASGSVVVAAAIVLVAAMVWGVFRVPDDPGPAPFAVPGPLRLVIEAAVFAGGVLGLAVAWGPVPAIPMAVVLLVHYATTPRRLGYVVSCRGWGRSDWDLQTRR